MDIDEIVVARFGLGLDSEVVFVPLFDEILVEVEVEVVAVTVVMVEGKAVLLMKDAARTVLEAEKVVSLQNCLEFHVLVLQAVVVEEELPRLRAEV